MAEILSPCPQCGKPRSVEFSDTEDRLCAECRSVGKLDYAGSLHEASVMFQTCPRHLGALSSWREIRNFGRIRWGDKFDEKPFELLYDWLVAEHHKGVEFPVELTPRSEVARLLRGNTGSNGEKLPAPISKSKYDNSATTPAIFKSPASPNASEANELTPPNKREGGIAVASATFENTIESAILIARNAPGTRPTSSRDAVLLAWYEAEGTETFHSYVNIVEKWNNIGREKWVAICPKATTKVNRQSAIKAIKAAKTDRGDKPKNKTKQRKKTKS